MKDPGCPGCCLMGIEMVRLITQLNLLVIVTVCVKRFERLGWRISRIWSTDWFSNPDDNLSDFIRKLLSLKHWLQTLLYLPMNM
ncbi:hypothetical protein [Klebsiella pneumoniae]|uniref:hypothetical protein n=1 Tax=Klebsiella pneumoniae TaxID=573 RepID=UPI003970EAFD